VIPPKSDQPRQPSFDKAAYRQRNHAMVAIAAIVLLWLE
jgi:hypothetical protein